MSFTVSDADDPLSESHEKDRGNEGEIMKTLKNSFCPMIKSLCMGEVCIAYKIEIVDAKRGIEEAVCTYFNATLGRSLQPRRDVLSELKLEDIEK